MGLKQFLRDFTPAIIKARYTVSRDLKELNIIPKIECDTANLRVKKDLSLGSIFGSAEIANMWNHSSRDISTFDIPDGSGGVNPGDRRALYYLISKFKPSSVLEVGTHIGASTVHIASALYEGQIKNGSNATLTTVDIVDVNAAATKPWLAYGTSYSPAEMINKLNYGSFVKFVSDTSVHYAATTRQKFDFIFLDGSHDANVVYQEIPMALKLLNPNGVILLHDFFPHMKRLWSNGSVLPGPYLAAERLKKEGVNAAVIPLGELPWPTKLGSNITSLALLLKNN